MKSRIIYLLLLKYIEFCSFAFFFLLYFVKQFISSLGQRKNLPGKQKRNQLKKTQARKYLEGCKFLWPLMAKTLCVPGHEGAGLMKSFAKLLMTFFFFLFFFGIFFLNDKCFQFSGSLRFCCPIRYFKKY